MWIHKYPPRFCPFPAPPVALRRNRQPAPARNRASLRAALRRAAPQSPRRRSLFKIVLGFTPRRRPWKAGPSQNDDFLPRFGIYLLYTALQGTSIPKRFGTTLFRLLCGTSRSYFSASGGVCGVLRACFDLIPQPEWRVLLSRTCISMLLRLFKIVW